MLSCSSFLFYFSKSEFLPSYCPFPSPKNPWTKPKTNTWSDWIFSSSSSSSLELQCVLLLHYSGSDITEAVARNLPTLSPIWFPSLVAFAWIFATWVQSKSLPGLLCCCFSGLLGFESLLISSSLLISTLWSLGFLVYALPLLVSSGISELLGSNSAKIAR